MIEIFVLFERGYCEATVDFAELAKPGRYPQLINRCYGARKIEGLEVVRNDMEMKDWNVRSSN